MICTEGSYVSFLEFGKRVSIIVSHCHLQTKVFEGPSRHANLEPVLVCTETVGEATKVSFIEDQELKRSAQQAVTG